MSELEGAIDKRGFVPLYYQIQQALLEKILSGELREGDLLSSEDELSKQYRVSRMTARQALQGLKDKGYAVSERGRGTFVLKPKLSKSILMLESFTEEIRRKGGKPSSKLLAQKVIPASQELVDQLKLEKQDQSLLHLRRLRLADDLPLAIEETHIPLWRFPGLDQIDFSSSSLYETLRDRYNVGFGWADETVEALSASADQSKLLTIPKRASLLCIYRTLMEQNGTPIEYAVSHYRGDRYRASLRVTLQDAKVLPVP
ncbi:GntR family transcriptional regulator [Granulicella cerasi]|uniref:GntR family transcriptional regulator n=1 Tax=Granulicella cerasi TaxID=741063 RepID=A0ABW1Z843_9BACT|nr:GntR family transcriptional regulator [Granulicella cerasi]